jgi:hypothetical protein
MKLKSLGYAALIAVTAVVFALASATTGEAKGKKKKAAAAPTPVLCFYQHKPVCATKGGLKFTYDNACWAAKDGAKVISNKACPAKKAKKAKKPKKKAAKAKKPAKKKM